MALDKKPTKLKVHRYSESTLIWCNFDLRLFRPSYSANTDAWNINELAIDSNRTLLNLSQNES
jgi:hypothetical protein